MFPQFLRWSPVILRVKENEGEKRSEWILFYGCRESRVITELYDARICFEIFDLRNMGSPKEIVINKRRLGFAFD